MRQVLQTWATPMLADPLAWDARGYQSYTVLSLCRILYTLEHGTVVSKAVAARWALATLDKRWIGLIERAVIGRHVGGEILPGDVTGTREFIRYSLRRSRELGESSKNG
jgi:hypothetical protein